MPTLSRNLIISILLALAAAGALLVYTAQVRDNANAGSTAIRVVVATHDVTVGTTVSDAQSRGYLSYQTVRQSDLADGAVTDFSAVEGDVVTQPLYAGDQLTVNRVGAQRSQTPAYQVTGNFRAVRVPFDPNSGLLADVQPNDHVDVLTSYRQDNKTYTYLSVPDALVLQVDQPSTTSGLSNANQQGSLLLSVTEQQSLLIANALANSSNGQSGNNIWLALVGAKGATYRSIIPTVLPGPFPHHGLPTK
jgi:Flp pilus assembly protein CpaB